MTELFLTFPQAQRAAQNANLKLDDLKTEITQRLAIDEPLSDYMEKKGKEIRSEMVGTAESVYSSVIAISNKPAVKWSIFGFLAFYALSIVWAARILFFDKKREETREQFGRELRLQKLREGVASAPTERARPDYTEINVNGRNVPSVNDEDFRKKVRKIQEMARAVRASENEVFVPSESGFVGISGKEPVAEPEKQESPIPAKGKELLKRRKQRQMPVEIQDKVVGVENNVSGEKITGGAAGSRHAKFVNEPESPVSTDPLKPVAVQAETPSTIWAEDTKNVGVSETLQSKVMDEDSNSARSTDALVPLQGDVVPSLNGGSKPHRSALNGSAKTSTDGKPTPSTVGEVKLPINGNATPNINSTARPVPPVINQPMKFKSMRVITSPQEARARIAARKAKDGNASAKDSSANSARPNFPKIKMPAVELAADLGTDSEVTEQGKDSVGGADDQSLKGNKVNSKSSELKSEERQDEEAWMRDEVLRRIVLKVRDNEEAGRDSFHGLDSEEEQNFFKGLERKFEREGDAVKTWIQDRVENLDYGLGGVGVDDPPESVFPRWKDPETPRAKRFEKFQEDRKRILEQQMGTSTPSQTERTSSASTPSSSPPSSAPKPSTRPPSKPSPKPSSSSPSTASVPSSNDASNKDESRERLQSNRNASGSRTVVTTTGKQAKPAPREWQHTKKWAQDLQRKYDLESDPQQRAIIEEVGQDLDRWITEDEIEEAQRLLSKGVAGEQEYVKMHYEKTREKMKKQHEMFGSQGMLNKYSEYKETKKEVELWWLDLPFVCCIGLSNSSDNGETSQGFYSLDMTPDFAGMVTQGGKTPTYNHTIAFQDAKDASNFCGLLLSERHMADVIPIAPKDLYQDAKQEGFKVTVIKKGQLGLVPGQALEDVEQRLIEIGSSIYWEELERMRSIDMDSVLDEGLGYGRPSR